MQEKSHTRSLTHPFKSAIPAPARCSTGLIILPSRPALTLGNILGRRSVKELKTKGQSNNSYSLTPYASCLDILAEFRSTWQTDTHTDEPLVVWITNPLSHTKINPSYFFARGFSVVHTLFLESPHVQRTLPTLIDRRRRIAAIILDGYPRDRVVLQLARRWLKLPCENAVVSADTLEAQRNKNSSERTSQPSSNRLFIMTRSDTHAGFLQ
jgi:hypothetical protein